MLALTWGLSFLFIAVSLESFTPIGVAMLRITLGALALVIWSLLTKQRAVREKRIWLRLIVVGFFLNVFPSLMFAMAEQLLTSSLAGILNATTPLFSVMFITLVFRGEKINPSQVFGLFLGFIGVLILFGDFDLQGSNPLLGTALILMATLGYGFAFPFAKKQLSNTGYSSTSLATAQLVASFTLLLPLGLTQNMLHASVEFDSVAAIVLLGFFGTGFAYIWNYRVIDLVGSAIASTVTYLSPLVAVIAGWAILKEAIHPTTFLGAAIIVFSAAIVQKRLNPQAWASRFRERKNDHPK
jgi:drug/metabolite transporter (DMT)-like permease